MLEDAPYYTGTGIVTFHSRAWILAPFPERRFWDESTAQRSSWGQADLQALCALLLEYLLSALLQRRTAALSPVRSGGECRWPHCSFGMHVCNAESLGCAKRARSAHFESSRWLASSPVRRSELFQRLKQTSGCSSERAFKVDRLKTICPIFQCRAIRLGGFLLSEQSRFLSVDWMEFKPAFPRSIGPFLSADPDHIGRVSDNQRRWVGAN
jgi:hypothetical protein